MIPCQLAVFVSALFVLSLYDRLSPRQIARRAFVLLGGVALLVIVPIGRVPGHVQGLRLP
jgi:hypothetical protein